MSTSFFANSPDRGREARHLLETMYRDPSRQSVTPRQRVERAIQHQPVDRIPFDFWAVPEQWLNLKQYLEVDTDEELLQLLGIDCRQVVPPYIGPAPIHLEGAIFIEPWGSHRRRQATTFGTYNEYAIYPLVNAQKISEIEDYAYWPRPEYWDTTQLKQQIERINSQTEYHIRYEVGGIFESAWGLYGLESFLVDMAMGEMEIPNAIMACYTDLFIANVERVLQAGEGQVDMVYLFDDLGTQRGPLMSVNMWRKYILPWQLKLVAAIRPFGVRIMYHSCGAIYPFIHDLVREMKIDVLNPLQPRAAGMDFVQIKNEYGQQLTFHGGIDIQETLPYGSPERVQKEVIETCRILGRNSGYICAPAHNIQADTPADNIIAMYLAPRASNYSGEQI